MYRTVTSGVVRIDTSNCTDLYTGTGFLLDSHTIATVAHVVEGQGTIRVTSPTSHVTTTATVIGVSHQDDVALLRTSVSLAGYHFTFAKTYPRPASDMMAIGFPLGFGMRPTLGTVNAVHQHAVVPSESGTPYNVSDAIVTDAAINGGNSGGPWLSHSGQVIAITESGPGPIAKGQSAQQGDNFGVSSIVAADDIRHWMADPQLMSRDGGCPAAGLSETAALLSLDDYFDDIDQADYDSAFALRDPASREDYADFLQNLLTTNDQGPDGSPLYLEDDSGIDAVGRRYVDVTFVSHQDPGRGPAASKQDTCDTWSLRYTFVLSNGVPVITDAQAQPGMKAYRTC